MKKRPPNVSGLEAPAFAHTTYLTHLCCLRIVAEGKLGKIMLFVATNVLK